VSWPAPPDGTGWWSGAPSPSDRRRQLRRWWLTAIVLLLAAAASLGLALRGHQRSLAGPLSTGGSATAPRAVRPAGRSVPVTLSIPAIGLKVPVSELGLNPDHTIQVPTDFQEPGWYRLGPSPGQLGSAVILGHVDSYQGPAVFFRLRTLQTGDSVDVTLADGVITHFAVREIAMYRKTNFPTVLVYGSHGYSGLQLVTCGGVFDTQTRSYLSNVVVYTSLVATTPPGTT
jgi:LPXTG-site transpeptidase (sortase) family protein